MNTQNALAYLCVDDFINTFVKAQVLKSAFEIGAIDYLQQNQPCTLDTLERKLLSDRTGIALLLDLLKINGAIEEDNGQIQLSSQFAIALQYRDLLQVKLDFANWIAPDFANHFTLLLENSRQFMERSRLFDLFGYHRCFEPTSENYELTKRWLRITTTLTKYEAQVCLQYHDFSQYKRILDIGGNSGEFVLQICKQHPKLLATVIDLPLVCDLGQAHIAQEPEANRINFIKGNALVDSLSTEFNLITFKSILHDWPEEASEQFIANASKSLAPGGTLLIFERGKIELTDKPLPYSLLPMLLLFRYFRSPLVYQRQLKAQGFEEITIQSINLEMPFFLIVAKKSKV
ncbi:methyltransferase [Nostoc sp. UIC 10630]|uniref:methyltransferase n=1 Tax=Nostoc sp. UIC 10630 TaxID=2100146 RepID=UPI0013D06041|nr:methyltransferase [Nostoc sp. UIC 10630]NEU80300.1 methyltransferase type 12 [Nostoc sp. UIC 10630]